MSGWALFRDRYVKALEVEIDRLRAELARTPIRLTADEAEKVRLAIVGTDSEVDWPAAEAEALALLAGGADNVVRAPADTAADAASAAKPGEGEPEHGQPGARDPVGDEPGRGSDPGGAEPSGDGGVVGVHGIDRAAGGTEAPSSRLIGVFCRPNHPKGYGYGETAHGYVTVLVVCDDHHQLRAVTEKLRGEGYPEPYGHPYPWYGGRLDLVATFAAPRPGDGGFVLGHWVGLEQMSPPCSQSLGDNRFVAVELAKDILA